MDRICSSSLRGVMVLMVDGPIVAGMEAPERTTGWCSFIMCLYFGLDSSVGSFVVVMELQNKVWVIKTHITVLHTHYYYF